MNPVASWVGIIIKSFSSIYHHRETMESSMQKEMLRVKFSAVHEDLRVQFLSANISIRLCSEAVLEAFPQMQRTRAGH